MHSLTANTIYGVVMLHTRYLIYTPIEYNIMRPIYGMRFATPGVLNSKMRTLKQYESFDDFECICSFR